MNHGGTCADIRIDGPGRGSASSLYQTSLPGFLKDLGFHTTFIGGFGERHSAWHFYAGFREMHDTGLRGMESAEHVTPTAIDWIERNGEKDNWYLHINYWDPHGPYRAPESIGNPFQNDPLPEWFTPEILEQHRSLVGPHTARDINMYDNKHDPRFPRYLGEVKDMKDLGRTKLCTGDPARRRLWKALSRFEPMRSSVPAGSALG